MLCLNQKDTKSTKNLSVIVQFTQKIFFYYPVLSHLQMVKLKLSKISNIKNLGLPDLTVFALFSELSFISSFEVFTASSEAVTVSSWSSSIPR